MNFNLSLIHILIYCWPPCVEWPFGSGLGVRAYVCAYVCYSVGCVRAMMITIESTQN